MGNGSALDEQLVEIMKAMKDEGLTDELFNTVRGLKDVNGPKYFSELIPQFRSDVQDTLKDMETALKETDVNFYDMNEHCIKIKGGISCIGACRLADACTLLKRAIESQSKERCVEAYDVLKQEYHTLDGKLVTVLQLEMQIITSNADENHGNDN